MKDALSLFASRFTPPGWKAGEAQSFCIPSLTGSADAFLALTLANDEREEERGKREKSYWQSHLGFLMQIAFPMIFVS